MAKTLSISISKIIGTDKRNIAKPIDPEVKSRSEPAIASRKMEKKLCRISADLTPDCTGVFPELFNIKICLFRKKRKMSEIFRIV